jgi:hypothetical protein
MKSINVYPGQQGWFYEVWLAERLLVFGWSRTQERAHMEASLS